MVSGDEKEWAELDDTEEGGRMDDGLENRTFEFVALEVCLEATCWILYNETKMLEPEASDEQTSNCDLEHFREIKRQVAQVDDRLTKLSEHYGSLFSYYESQKVQLRNAEGTEMVNFRLKHLAWDKLVELLSLDI